MPNNTGLRSGAGVDRNHASHVGIYIGDGKFVHSANPTDGTVIEDLAVYESLYPQLGYSYIMIDGGY